MDIAAAILADAYKPKGINGASGIARHGREVEYATELWLEGPSAFWLHPEGPLSDTTPDEWLEKQPKPDPIDPMLAQIGAAYSYAGLLNTGSHMAAFQQGYLQSQSSALQQGLSNNLFAGIIRQNAGS